MSQNCLWPTMQATTALSDTALKAMLPYFNQSYGNPSSLYSFAQQAKSDLEAAGPRWPPA